MSPGQFDQFDGDMMDEGEEQMENEYNDYFQAQDNMLSPELDVMSPDANQRFSEELATSAKEH